MYFMYIYKECSSKFKKNIKLSFGQIFRSELAQNFLTFSCKIYLYLYTNMSANTCTRTFLDMSLVHDIYRYIYL